MDKTWLFKRLQEMGAEFIRHVDGTIGHYTVYKNTPLGYAFINIYYNAHNDTYGFIDITWNSNTGRMPDAEILTEFSLDNLKNSSII